jgi:SAM-dependent methyltransferase
LPFSTQEQTNQEVEFLSESFSYYPGGHVLDVACGYGRHALPLAKRGFQVTGIDLSLPLLLRAADEAQRLGIPVNFIHTDMREISFQSQFNGAYCTLTSFGYFDEETNLKLAQAICQSLKPGGRFLLDVLNRDYVVSDLPSRVWWEGNGCVVLEEVEFNYQTSRLQIHRSIVFNEGHQVEQDLSLRIYSLHELGKLLRAAGFRVMEISGSVTTRGHFFGAASRQILLLCERPET